MSNKKTPKLWLLKRPAANGPKPADYLDEKYFTITIAAAIALHIAGIYLWHLMPHTEVIDIPVHALSIKLGDGEPLTPEEQQPAVQAPQAEAKDKVDSA